MFFVLATVVVISGINKVSVGKMSGSIFLWLSMKIWFLQWLCLAAYLNAPYAAWGSP